MAARGRFTALALLAGMVVPVCASGQVAELVQLQWDAPPGCPAAATVLARVDALAGTADPTASPLRAAAVISRRSNGRFHLQLVVHKEGLVGERELEASSCDDLAGAVAVNLALLLEDSATLLVTDAASASDSAAATQRANSQAGTSAPSAPSASPVMTTSRPQSVRALLQAPLASLAIGSMPAPSVGLTLAGGVAFDAWRVAAGGTLWLHQTGESTRPETGAELARLSARVHICRGFRVGPLDLAPSLSLSLEHLRAQGSGPYVRPASAAAIWLAAGAGIQARFPITPWLNMLGSAELKLQAARPRVSIEGVGRIFELGLVGAELSFGSEWIL